MERQNVFCISLDTFTQKKTAIGMCRWRFKSHGTELNYFTSVMRA